MQSSDFLTSTLNLVRESCEISGIDDKYMRLLSRTDRKLTVEYPVRMDDGNISIVKAFRIQHTNALGPYKGGIRISPMSSEAEVTALSMLMSLKCAILGLPYGGSKGGIVADAGKLSKNELERVCRGYIRAIYPVIGPDMDIPAPDMNVSEESIGWMLDEYEKMAGYSVPAVITGKPVVLGGIKGRKTAVAWGGIFIMEEAERLYNCKCKSFAIQGFGNVGGSLASILYEKGKKVVAVSDSTGGVYREDGLNIPALFKHKAKTGSVLGFGDSGDITNKELLELETDFLVPAATEDQITGKNAANIGARAVLSLANGPVDKRASEILNDRGIFVIPDVLANGGGVVVSHFEWAQGRQGYAWSGPQVSGNLKLIMKKAFREVHDVSVEYKKDMYTAAYILGVNNIVSALNARSV